jgi:hypothetical protein
MVNVGDSVTISDENRVEHVALVTAIHGWTTPEQKKAYQEKMVADLEAELESDKTEEWKQTRVRPALEGARAALESDAPFVPSCINVVYVSKDASKHDPYGNQLERLSSLQHESAVQNMTVPGRFYRL